MLMKNKTKCLWSWLGEGCFAEIGAPRLGEHHALALRLVAERAAKFNQLQHSIGVAFFLSHMRE